MAHDHLPAELPYGSIVRLVDDTANADPNCSAGRAFVGIVFGNARNKIQTIMLHCSWMNQNSLVHTWPPALLARVLRDPGLLAKVATYPSFPNNPLRLWPNRPASEVDVHLDSEYASACMVHFPELSPHITSTWSEMLHFGIYDIPADKLRVLDRDGVDTFVALIDEGFDREAARAHVLSLFMPGIPPTTSSDPLPDL